MVRVLVAIGALAIALSAPCCAGDISACQTLMNSRELREPGPLFLTSFPGAASGPLHDAAFLYDNAVAIIALVGCGRADQASRIGKAILIALDNDRYWKDGRLRNAYLAGAVEHTPLPLPGWWDPVQNKWVEDRYQVGSDTGNMAWVMLALLTLYEQEREPSYLLGAERIGRYIETSWSEVRPRGYEGGTFGHEPAPDLNRWKSTEHNTDLAAAFGRLARNSGDKHWSVLSKRATAFVAAMWGGSCHCFAVGTGDDGHTRNHILALDAQLWPVLAIPGGMRRFPGALATAKTKLLHGDGFSYSETGNGIWTEGTAQAGLLMALYQPSRDQVALLRAITRNRAADGYYYASDGPSLPTGFQLQTDPTKPREYYHTPHLAALAWVALLEQRFNPFTGTSALPKNP